MKKLRVAVMGCGRIAAVYKTALQNLSDQCQVVLAMDKDPARARAFAAAFDGCEASALVSSAGFASALSHSGAELVHILLPPSPARQVRGGRHDRRRGRADRKAHRHHAGGGRPA